MRPRSISDPDLTPALEAGNYLAAACALTQRAVTLLGVSTRDERETEADIAVAMEAALHGLTHAAAQLDDYLGIPTESPRRNVVKVDLRKLIYALVNAKMIEHGYVAVDLEHLQPDDS